MPSQGVTNVANAIINKINNLISSHNNNSNAHQDIREDIPRASSATPLSDTQNGGVGTGTTWARSNHTHPKSSLYAEANHTHGNISNDGKIGTSNNSNKNVVTDASGKITIENKPTIPIASTSIPSADTTNGGVGTGTAWARSDHTHPKSSLYAKASHTHPQYLTSHQDITGKEDKSNKVTSLSSSNTDTEYPSAKAVYDAVNGFITDLYDVMDCINVNFNDLDNIYLLDTVFDISNYNGLPSKKSSVVNDILRNNAVSQIGLNKEFTPSTKYTLEFDYYTSVGNRNGFYFGADPSLEDGASIDYSDTGLQVVVDIGNTFVETFNGTSSPTKVYTHTSNLFTSGTHHIRIVRNNTNVVFYIDDVKLYTYTNAKYNTIGLNKWGSEYNTISNIEMEIGG